MNIDKELHLLEEAFRPYPGAVSGTSLSRVMMDVSLLAKHNIKKTTERESQSVWCLSLGNAGDRKSFFYANTVSEVIQRAKSEIRQRA